MTEKELKSRMEVRWRGYGTYGISILYRGKWYSCISHNSLAYDMLDEYESVGYYTSKQAYQALWDECCRTNNLK